MECKSRNILLRADETAFVAHNHQDAQEIIIRVSKSAEAFGQKICRQKTEAIYASPGISWYYPRYTERERERETGTNPSKKIQISRLDRRQQQRSCGPRYTNVICFQGPWLGEEASLARQNPSIKSKCTVHRVIVILALLYGAETWTVYKADAPRLHVYTMRHLRKILNGKWGQHIPN